MRNFKDINFLDSMEIKNNKKSLPILLSVLGVLFVLLIGSFSLEMTKDVNLLREEKKQLTERTENIESEIKELESKLNIQKQELANTDDTVTMDIVDTFESDFNYRAEKTLESYSPLDSRMIKTLTSSTPEGVFITNYIVNDDVFILKGYAKKNTYVATLSYNLRQYPFIEAINITSTDLVSEEDVDQYNYNLYSFEIQGTIKGGALSEY